MTTEDQWAWVNIGSPFPENPVRVQGQNNMYVALWYKHGKPVCGRAWNDGGVVECSFPYNGKELTGKRDLGGEIQILTYKGKFDNNKYWYEWVDFKSRSQSHLKMVFCGNSAPILMSDKGGKPILGNIDLTSEMAGYSEGGKAVTAGGLPIQTMKVICRNHRKPDQPIGDDAWVDVRINDRFPADPAVLGAGRKLRCEGGLVSHVVALWYKHGEPLMGRAEDLCGKVSASFGWDGKEFTGNIGSIQVLTYTSEGEMGFSYRWLPYREAKAGKDFVPVHVNDVAPCVIKTPTGHERLGMVKLSKEEASVSWGGKQEVYKGPAVHPFLVLCRNNPQY